MRYSFRYSTTTILDINQPLRRNSFISNIFGFGKEKEELFEKVNTFAEKVCGYRLS